MSQLTDRPAATGFVAAPQPSALQRFFAFPNPVNEYAARCTAGIVVVLATVAVIGHFTWLVGLVALGFLLRLAFGPRVSPAALLSVKILAPRFGEPKMVPGPPKRFAQGMGAAMSLAAFVLLLSGAGIVAWPLLLLLIVAATLEAAIGLCLGCLIFGVLQRRGLIPERVCAECANFSLRRS